MDYDKPKSRLERMSIKALENAIDLQLTKGADYNGKGIVKQAEYYPRGIISIHEMMNAKMLRIKSVMYQALEGSTSPNHESLQDSVTDLINYASFFIEYLNKGMEGQDQNKDIFNRDITNATDNS
jgi:hypothetical protein